MITKLHRGEGSLGTPKSDYVICARPLCRRGNSIHYLYPSFFLCRPLTYIFRLYTNIYKVKCKSESTEVSLDRLQSCLSVWTKTWNGVSHGCLSIKIVSIFRSWVFTLHHNISLEQMNITLIIAISLLSLQCHSEHRNTTLIIAMSLWT